MDTDTEQAYLKSLGFECSDGMLRDKPSLQHIMAHRRYHELDYARSFLLFIERARYRTGGGSTTRIVAEYDVRLVYPWPWDEDGRPHPGMCQMEAGRELGMLLGLPFNRQTAHILLDCEPYVLIDALTRYLERPDLRVAFGVAYHS
ncbi:MAG: hypothetical protein ACXWP0_01155 [Ktedonobacterales bacterium]